MSFANRLRYWHLVWFSKPKCDRVLYRAIRQGQVDSILEIGIGSPLRTQRMIRLAAANCRSPIRYAAIDEFEMRPAGNETGISLKSTHRWIRKTPASARLLPGDPFAVLARKANSLGTFGLIVISKAVWGESLSRAWFYFPRMLHATSQIWMEQNEGLESEFRRLSRAEVESLARGQSRRRAA